MRKNDLSKNQYTKILNHELSNLDIQVAYDEYIYLLDSKFKAPKRDSLFMRAYYGKRLGSLLKRKDPIRYELGYKEKLFEVEEKLNTRKRERVR